MKTVLTALGIAALQAIWVVAIMLLTSTLVTWLLPTNAPVSARAALALVIAAPLFVISGRLLVRWGTMQVIL